MRIKEKEIKELLMQGRAMEVAIEHINRVLAETENFLKYVELVKENFETMVPDVVFFVAAHNLLEAKEELEYQKNDISSKIEELKRYLKESGKDIVKVEEADER